MIERRDYLLGISGVIGAITVGMVMSNSPNGEVANVMTPETIESSDSFTISAETSNSSATVIEVTGDAENISLSSNAAIEKTENQIRFIDVSSSDSTHTVSVDITNGEHGGEITINTWVNDEKKANADDVVEKVVSIEQDTGDDIETPTDVEKALVAETTSGAVTISKTVRLHNGCAETDKGTTGNGEVVAWFDSIDESDGTTMCTMMIEYETATMQIDAGKVEAGDEITIKDNEIDKTGKYTVTGDKTTNTVTLD